MKDKVKDKKTEDVLTEKTGTEKGKEAIEILTVQHKEHLDKAKEAMKGYEHHQTMALKAQGALDVLLQLHPEDKENK